MRRDSWNAGNDGGAERKARHQCALEAERDAAESARTEIQYGIDWLETQFARLCVRAGEQPPPPGMLAALLFGQLVREVAPIGTYRTVPEILARLAALAFEDQPFPEEVYREAVAAAELLDDKQPPFENRKQWDLAILGKALLIRQGCPEYRNAIRELVRKGDNLSYWLAHWDNPPTMEKRISDYIALTAQLAADIGPEEPFLSWAQIYFGVAGSLARRDQMASFLLPYRPPILTTEDRRQEILAGLYTRGYITTAIWRRINESSCAEPIELGDERVESLEVLTDEACLTMATDQAVPEEELLAGLFGRDGLDPDELRFVEAKLEGKPWTQVAADMGWSEKRADTVKHRCNRLRAKVTPPPLHACVRIGHQDVPAGALERLPGGHLIWRPPR